MTIINKQSKKEKVPLGFTVLFSVFLLFFLSSIGLYAYQKTSQENISRHEYVNEYINNLGILEDEDLIDISWLHTLNPLVKNVQGRLLWSGKKQLGVMEFYNLPKLKDNQRYKLLISDLSSSKNKPVLAVFVDSSEKLKQKKRTILLFKGSTKIESPFKFELILDDKVTGTHPLLLAQP